MSLRKLESFDHFNTHQDLVDKWTSVSASGNSLVEFDPTGPPQSLQTTSVNEFTHTFDSQSTWIMGGWFFIRAMSASVVQLFQVFDAGGGVGVMSTFELGTDRKLRIYLGENVAGNLKATSTDALALSTHYWIECKHVIDNAAGTLEIRVDETVVATFTGDTQVGAVGTADRIDPMLYLSGAGGLIYWDSGFIFDGTGSTNNDYPGLSQVDCLWTSAAGTYAEFDTAVLATNTVRWQAVGETFADNDTSYIESAVDGDRETNKYQDLLPAVTAIRGIQVVHRAKYTGASGIIRRLYRRGGTDYEGANITLASSYDYYLETFDTDPNGGAAFDPANFRGGLSEFGTKVIGANNARVTQVVIELLVNYHPETHTSIWVH